MRRAPQKVFIYGLGVKREVLENISSRSKLLEFVPPEAYDRNDKVLFSLIESSTTDGKLDVSRLTMLWADPTYHEVIGAPEFDRECFLDKKRLILSPQGNNYIINPGPRVRSWPGVEIYLPLQSNAFGFISERRDYGRSAKNIEHILQVAGLGYTWVF